MSAVHPRAIVLSWSDISLATADGKNLLRYVDGRAMPGEILAILGPSGSGKSTLLDVLRGKQMRELHRRGTVALDGQVVFPRTLKKAVSFVEQNENFLVRYWLHMHIISVEYICEYHIVSTWLT